MELHLTTDIDTDDIYSEIEDKVEAAVEYGIDNIDWDDRVADALRYSEYLTADDLSDRGYVSEEDLTDAVRAEVHHLTEQVMEQVRALLAPDSLRDLIRAALFPAPAPAEGEGFNPDSLPPFEPFPVGTRVKRHHLRGVVQEITEQGEYRVQWDDTPGTYLYDAYSLALAPEGE
jgi:hypothetical protein